MVGEPVSGSPLVPGPDGLPGKGDVLTEEWEAGAWCGFGCFFLGKISNQPELLQLLNALLFIFVIQSCTLLTKLVFYFYSKSS